MLALSSQLTVSLTAYSLHQLTSIGPILHWYIPIFLLSICLVIRIIYIFIFNCKHSNFLQHESNEGILEDIYENVLTEQKKRATEPSAPALPERRKKSRKLERLATLREKPVISKQVHLCPFRFIIKKLVG